MDDKIIHCELGDAHSVKTTNKMHKMANPNNRLAIIRAHTIISKNDSALPVSWGDFLTINANEGTRSIYAINSLGEYLMLQKEENIKPSIFKEPDVRYETNFSCFALN